MAEDSGQEKTEEPTSKKLEDAKKKGQIARSKELGTMFVLIFSAISLLLYGPEIGKGLYNIMGRMLSLNRSETYDTTKMFAVWSEVASALLFPVAMFVLIIVIAAFIGNTLLGGFNFSWEAAAPKPSKMSPIKGFKRMFGPQAAIELVKSILKFALVAIFAVFLIQTFFDEILHLSIESAPSNIIHALEMLSWMFLGLSCTLVIIAAIDAPYQSYNHNKQLKMTMQEIKDEYKNSEGDPQIKARIRQTQRQMSQRRMMQDVPDADVIVTNPTHYSVALKYDTERAGAPIVLAKGIDEMAMQIRKIAKGNEVPIVESPMLTRALYHTAEIGQQIPDQLFTAVAQVLAYVFQLKRFKKGRGKRPIPLKSKLPIPDDFKYD
ncbi:MULTISPECIES: flagellar biosynthesis protein FlhB [unclassified Pseudoalteromonas]|jgi:flagellar biosynthetic protein FlhB|uniref:flagellar biosynthesis protein FlhB n=1 Tax=Pseudoalteromonas TaxID=53246 RepID=UPI000410D69A|nr:MULTISPECIES: flagellar biosynthesis protein FlhB [unclassified Pseudoalteromonas]MDC9521050.1 flagellar biosynthesis protein FlhB [Pseudoalteromonas sp. Angola-31]MDC9497173.1 flagellar biosynthesis protein FlhB [Pseudoalteromonas sp. Angola-20]MDC9510446.1 flagellar biosynthesis protein FlhB [Pseudoalteromonas sp. Angola-4]MDC9517626.1 flagellar biosynthesis protein FlhB [Pseudoalteromonas sp. Angola-22]MDC9530619.1 flagellar biosynthesis protein FlhB [Pseudoalteromonas sp. Angola-7]|tara:strand:+ start:5586 stop:6719 length:1134 start_codon:yes stop_codon:yes gene_type:complete